MIAENGSCGTLFDHQNSAGWSPFSLSKTVIDYEETKKGFRIYSSDVRNTFRREMKSSIDEKIRKKMSFSQSELHSQFYDKSKSSIRDCKPYLETIWELATLCSVPYFENSGKYPVDFDSFAKEEKESDEFSLAQKFIEERQTQFLNDNFRLVFDGIELRRHIQLPTEENAISKIYYINFDDTVFELPLKFSGYLFAQIPRAIRPFELNGIQVRLRGVGIGGYDSTFLRYSKQIETIRSRWVSGEIFVEQGLEDALNIDRDSFNEHDEHFKRLQETLHTKLNQVFDDINAIARERSEQRRDDKDLRMRQSLQTSIAKESNGKLELVQRDLDENAPIITVNETQGKIILNTSARPLKKKKKDTIIRAVMLAYHSAKYVTESEEEQDRKFYELLKTILEELV